MNDIIYSNNIVYENPNGNSTSGFTIDVDVSKYKYFIITYLKSNQKSEKLDSQSEYIPAKEGSYYITTIMWTWDSVSYSQAGYRLVTVTDSSITVSIYRRKVLNGSTNTADPQDSKLVPTLIRGVKK